MGLNLDWPNGIREHIGKDFETWPGQTKVQFLLYFLYEHQIAPEDVLIHGSLSLEIMGFNLSAAGCGAQDIDIVCLEEGAFYILSQTYGTDPTNPERIGIVWEGVRFEIFSHWKPAPGLDHHNHIMRERSCSVVVPGLNGDGERAILVPNVIDVITYKNTRNGASPEKAQRDQMHLDVMLGQQRDLLVGLMNRAARLVGKDTKELAIQIALDSQKGTAES